jgi:uncharacterized membrane-anchored protein
LLLGYLTASAIFSLLLLALVILSLSLWRRVLGSISVETVHEPRAELFYWITITFSQTLGTASGDWIADTGGMSYSGAAALFGAALGLLLILYFHPDKPGDAILDGFHSDSPARRCGSRSSRQAP